MSSPEEEELSEKIKEEKEQIYKNPMQLPLFRKRLYKP